MKNPKKKDISNRGKITDWEIKELPHNPIFNKVNQNPDYKNQWNVNWIDWGNYSLADEIIIYHEKYYQYTLKLNRELNKDFNEPTLKPELYSEYYFDVIGHINDIDLQLNILNNKLESEKSDENFTKEKFENIFYEIKRCEHNKETLIAYSEKIKPFVSEFTYSMLDNSDTAKNQFYNGIGSNPSANIIIKNRFLWLESKTLLFSLFQELENMGFIYSEDYSEILKNFFLVYNKKEKRIEKLSGDSIKDFRSKVKRGSISYKSDKLKDVINNLKKSESIE